MRCNVYGHHTLEQKRLAAIWAETICFRYEAFECDDVISSAGMSRYSERSRLPDREQEDIRRGDLTPV